MNYLKTIATCFLSVLCACNEISDLQLPTVEITSNIFSRSTTDTLLPEGSTALFNASGALEIENQIFTLEQGIWRNGNFKQQKLSEGMAYITAFHPVLDEYSSTYIYQENKLTDILIAKDTLYAGKNIELRFKHLFSSLILNVNEDIQQTLKEIRLIVPETISNISIKDGTYTTETIPQTSTETYHTNGKYQFMLPPTENVALSLQIVMQDETIHSHTLAPYTFKSGYKYECNILNIDQRPGIRTADDLIAFSLLINKQSYTGEKTLADFGEEIDGKSVYRLLSDITLTEEDCKALIPIGYYDARAFGHIFDGEGHSISNLIIPDKSMHSKVNLTYSGLFGHIGSEGTVKNLHIKHAKTVEVPTCTRTGVIAAVNEGIISNCSVTHSTIINGKNEKFGYICGQLSPQGHIINCHASNNTISSQSNSTHFIGGIAAYANGTILNCYTSHNSYILTSNSQVGGIAGNSASNYLLTIENCYTYNEEENSFFYALMGHAKKVYVNNFLYNKGAIYNTEYSSAVIQENILEYEHDFTIDNISICSFLNNWITTTGKEKYPEFVFPLWKKAEDGSITFQ